MKLEYQVCSLELAKKLKELGVKQDSLFYWVVDNTHDVIKICFKNEDLYQISDDVKYAYIYTRVMADEHVNVKEIYSAFTVAEIGEMLPVFLEGENGISSIFVDRYYDAHGKNACWFIQYFNDIRVYNTNEADARAKMLIYLIENGLIKNGNNK